MQGEADITALLQSWEDGAPGALERLTPLVYDELHRIASRQFAREARNHTLQPTAVVHELFLDLMDRRQVRWQDRSHFFGFAARQMRRILVDHARRRKAGKRGGGAPIVSLEELPFVVDMTEDSLLRLDEALADLARFNPEGSRVVEMRFFGGLTHEEVARVLGVSVTTARNKWRAAKTWLHRELGASTEEVRQPEKRPKRDRR